METLDGSRNEDYRRAISCGKFSYRSAYPPGRPDDDNCGPLKMTRCHTEDFRAAIEAYSAAERLATSFAISPFKISSKRRRARATLAPSMTR